VVVRLHSGAPFGEKSGLCGAATDALVAQPHNCRRLIILGLFTRPVAFISLDAMAFADFMSHAPREGGVALLNNGNAAIIYCFIFL
jgi:hypothetical protein